MKTATEILNEHGINIMNLNDDFNTQLLHSMERYAEEKSNEKELIIYGITEGAEMWKSEYDMCRQLLQNLVSLKVIKDTQGKTDYYLKEQPLAWEEAIKFLTKYQHL